MARSLRVATTSLISGAVVVGNRGLGVLGSEVPSTGTHGPGYLYNDLTFPADADKEVRGVILTVPSSGTFFAYEDSSFSLIGAADGSYTFTYALYVDGAYTGDATAYITIGAGATATATITESDDTLAATAVASLASASAITEAPDAVAATANAALAATATPTEADDTLAADALLAAADTIHCAIVESDDVVASASTAALSAVASVFEDADAFAASSAAALFASLGITEADDLLSASCSTSAFDAIWGYIFSNGLSAEQNLVDIHAWLRELYQVHGLEIGSPVVVTPTARTAASVAQTISEVAGTVTMERNP